VRLVRLPLPGLLIAVLGGCGLITAPTEGNKLNAARRLWSDAALADYRYEVRSYCECLQGGRWIAVTVLAGRVNSGTYLDTETPVESRFLEALPTIPALFDRIQHAIDESAVLLEVEYDSAYGHPTLINVDISRAVADEEFSLQSRNLTALHGQAMAPEPR
jgi:hypothetical protein